MDSWSEIEQEIFSLAKKILDNKVDPLLGSQLLSSYRFQTERIQYELLFFTGIASQIEEFPLDEAERKLWSQEALARLDKEREEFLPNVEELIREKCSSIISRHSKCQG